jgi:carbon-monoxide dehydrogenase iron sulfur subunit
VGCRLCEVVCSAKKEGKINPRRARIHILSDNYKSRASIGVVCKQCETPSCIEVCGRKALVRDEKTGAIVIDEWSCNGCGKCVSACPNDAISLPENYKFPYLCNLCRGEPVCVKYCPTNALLFATHEEASATKRGMIMKRLERIPQTVSGSE